MSFIYTLLGIKSIPIEHFSLLKAFLKTIVPHKIYKTLDTALRHHKGTELVQS